MGSGQSKGGADLSPINNNGSSASSQQQQQQQGDVNNNAPPSWSATKHNIRQKKTTTANNSESKTFDGTSTSSNDDENNTAVARERATTRKVDPNQLAGVALIEYKCRKKKRAWSKCVSDHYEQKFLPGMSLEPEEDCDTLFDKYRTCYMKGMIHERQRMGAPPPKEGTMLHEFMEDEGMFADIAAADAQRK
jgi:hypothetical protein